MLGVEPTSFTSSFVKPVLSSSHNLIILLTLLSGCLFTDSGNPVSQGNSTSGQTSDRHCSDREFSDLVQCKGDKFNPNTCQTQGFDGGVLNCNDDCTLNLEKCFSCGDGKIDEGEACDLTSLGGKTCMSEGFTGGEMTCSNTCTLNTSACVICGDSVVGLGEDCEADNCSIQKNRCGLRSHLRY